MMQQRVDLQKVRAAAQGKPEEVVPVTRGFLDLVERELAFYRGRVAA
ncbi:MULTISPECIES: hypothetical protein [unclassified Sphingomonas]|nr:MULTISPECIES: hypothetical protein [unclassified Sphingomonas]